MSQSFVLKLSEAALEELLKRATLQIDNFGISDAIPKVFVRGASWTLDLHNSMKVCENPESVLTGLWILLHPNRLDLD